jgi:hypothetical protein
MWQSPIFHTQLPCLEGEGKQEVRRPLISYAIALPQTGRVGMPALR